MTVYCDADCKHNKKGECIRGHNISIEDLECEDYEEYPGNDPEYQEEYWVTCGCIEGGTRYRMKRRGKRYEALGRVFYTGCDIRWGVRDATFTDGATGIAVGGELFSSEVFQKKFLARIGDYPNVMTYPEKED